MNYQEYIGRVRPRAGILIVACLAFLLPSPAEAGGRIPDRELRKHLSSLDRVLSAEVVDRDEVDSTVDSLLFRLRWFRAEYGEQIWERLSPLVVESARSSTGRIESKSPKYAGEVLARIEESVRREIGR